MQMYEVRAVMKYQHFAYKDSWEQARMQAYIIAQCNSTKKLKPSDIMKFYWDKEEEGEDTFISNADVERLKEKAKLYETKLK